MTTLLVYAEAKRDVLARVAMLFHRRMIVIASLSMTPDTHPGILRMSITVDIDQDKQGRIVADLYKIVNVLSVQTVTQTEPAGFVPTT